MPLNNITKIRSFTLVELLIVIAILAVLAAAVVIVLNPAELLAQARDSQRITDLSALKNSVDLFIVDNPTTSLGTAQKVYISLPDAAAPLCTNNLASLPSLPAGWSYNCATSANLRNTDGTGWLPLNLSTIKGGSPIPHLPIDPQNNAATGKYYTFVTGASGWEVTSLPESSKYESASASDGGESVDILERGTKLGITPRVENYIGNGNFTGCLGVVNESDSVATNTIVPLENPGSSSCVDRQNGSGTEYEIHFKTGTQIEANTAYCMSLWVGYSAGYNGDSQVLHARWYDGASNPFTTSGAGTLAESKTVGGIVWEKRYITFNSPATVNGGYNWYVGYPTNNTVGYRYITDLSVTKTSGTTCPTVFTDRQ